MLECRQRECVNVRIVRLLPTPSYPSYPSYPTHKCQVLYFAARRKTRAHLKLSTSTNLAPTSAKFSSSATRRKTRARLKLCIQNQPGWALLVYHLRNIGPAQLLVQRVIVGIV